MTDINRKIGGDNNKRGNRYEDFFAVYRLVQFAPAVIDGGASVRVREQAACPVDDLLVREPAADHYHQLKDDMAITWGGRDGKLAGEFLAQKVACESAGPPFRLVVVVSEESRRMSLTDNLPANLAGCTDVILFPRANRPSDLVSSSGPMVGLVDDIFAGRAPGITDRQHLVRAFHSAWIDHLPDIDGYCDLGELVATIRGWGITPLRHRWTDLPPDWAEAARILNAIPGLSWTVDRGHFEWFFPPADRCLFMGPCAGENFGRFFRRVIERHPASFVEFEGLLP